MGIRIVRRGFLSIKISSLTIWNRKSYHHLRSLNTSSYGVAHDFADTVKLEHLHFLGHSLSTTPSTPLIFLHGLFGSKQNWRYI